MTAVEQHDSMLFELALREVSTDLVSLSRRIIKCRSLADVVNLTAELKATSERFESLSHSLLKFVGETTV